MTRPIDGRVKDAEVADLDVDQSPEISVYLTSDAGDSLVALSANKRKSLSDIDLSPLDETPGEMVGDRDRDAFAVGEGRLLPRGVDSRLHPARRQPLVSVMNASRRLAVLEAAAVRKFPTEFPRC